MKGINRFLCILFAVLVFISLSLFSIYEFFSGLELLGKRLTPFLVTKQLGIDALGMFFRVESFSKVLPLSYVKEVNKIPVKSDKEFYEILRNLPENTTSVEIKFSNPFFVVEDEYIVNVSLYEITYFDIVISFVLSTFFSLLLFSISLYLFIVLVKNLDVFSKYKKQLFLVTILLLTNMGILVTSGLDLVHTKKVLPLLYISFAITGIVLSLFFYYSSYHRLKGWIYVILSNVGISTILLTSYLVFFENSRILLSLVKVNYVVIALNVLIGVIYLWVVRKNISNVIEKERIKLTVIILIVPILVLALIFFVQGISFYTIPISVFFLFFVAVSPIISTVIVDHNVKSSKERIIFSVLIGVILIVGLSIVSTFIVNLSEEALFLFGIYGIPSVLFFSIVLWYGLEIKSQNTLDVFDVFSSSTKEDMKMYLFTKLKKRFPFIKDVKILLQYPIIYAEEIFITYNPHSELWDDITEKGVVTKNDIMYSNRFLNFNKVFESYGFDYIFHFQISNNKCIVGISSQRALTQGEIEQIELIVSSFSIDLQSFSIINAVKFMKVLSFEFDLLKQSQSNLLRSNRNITIETEFGKINVLNYWEPMIELAGDIYGMNKTDRYFTSWISDICGKGLTAAAISFTCYTLINQVVRNNVNIKESAKIINDILVSEPLFSLENFFLTLSGITINTETLEAEIINCANPPVIFFDGQKTLEINPKGGILGIFDDFNLDSYKIKLSKGMILLFFTDGMTDIIGNDSDYNDQTEFLKLLVEKHKSPNLIWENIMVNIQNLSLQKNITDDITLTMIYID